MTSIRQRFTLTYPTDEPETKSVRRDEIYHFLLDDDLGSMMMLNMREKEQTASPQVINGRSNGSNGSNGSNQNTKTKSSYLDNRSNFGLDDHGQ